MRLIIFHVPVAIFICLSVLYPHHVLGKEIDFRPLTLYLSDDPYTLGKGEPDIIRYRYHPDLYSPTTLLEQKGHLFLEYQSENVLNIKAVDQDKKDINFTSREVSGLIPLDLPLLKKSAVGFLLKDFEAHGNINDQDQGMFFRSSQEYRLHTIAFSSNPLSFIKAGVGWESYSDRDHIFLEAAVTPLKPISVGYRQYQREMHIDSSLIEDEHLAGFHFRPSEQVREISLTATAPDIIRLYMAIDDNHPENKEFSINASLGSSLSIGHHLMKRHLDFFNEIIIDDLPNGHNGGTIDYSSNGIEIAFHSSATQYLFGVKKSTFAIDGAGKVTGDSILNFWENLLAGDRFFNYNLRIRSTQYHIGIETRSTERLTLRGGLQYILTTPEGILDHWTPFPFVKIGRLDEEIINLGYEWARIGVLTFGFSYKFSNLELTYGIGQIIPLKVKKEKEVDGTVAETESSISGGNWDLGNLWETIKENPGGNLQIIRVSWYF